MDLISREDAIRWVKTECNPYGKPTLDFESGKKVIEHLKQMPSAQPEEVTPHRNYQYLSDYWCECGWHLGKMGDVNYCPNCGKKVKWDG